MKPQAKVSMDSSLMLFAFEGAWSMDHGYVAEVAVAHGEQNHEDDVGGIAVNEHLSSALLRGSVAVPEIRGGAMLLHSFDFLIHRHEQGDEGCSEHRGSSE